MRRAPRGPQPAAMPFGGTGAAVAYSTPALRGESERGDPHGYPRDQLLSTLEMALIPHLVEAHRSASATLPACTESRVPPLPEEIHEFAAVCAGHDLPLALSFIERMVSQGLSLEMVFLELVAPTARLLGEQWKSDHRSWTEVTAGLGTLHQIVHTLSPHFSPGVPTRGLVVLTAAPGEQHTLGLFLVGEFLRRAGWSIEIDPVCSEDELCRLVGEESATMVGFTVSNVELLPRLQSRIAAVRRAARNPRMAMLVGGPLDLTEFARRAGVDHCPADARQTVQWLENHVKVGL